MGAPAILTVGRLEVMLHPLAIVRGLIASRTVPVEGISLQHVELDVARRADYVHDQTAYFFRAINRWVSYSLSLLLDHAEGSAIGRRRGNRSRRGDAQVDVHLANCPRHQVRHVGCAAH